jgi:cell division protein FtsB
MRARRSSLFTRTIIWITGLICLALLLGSLVQAWSNNQLMRQVQQARQQVQQAQTHHDALSKLVDHYKDPFVIESEARQQLGYVRPGEHPVVIVGANEPGTQKTTHTTTSSPTTGFWQAWWNIFFGGQA